MPIGMYSRADSPAAAAGPWAPGSRSPDHPVHHDVGRPSRRRPATPARCRGSRCSAAAAPARRPRRRRQSAQPRSSHPARRQQRDRQRPEELQGDRQPEPDPCRSRCTATGSCMAKISASASTGRHCRQVNDASRAARVISSTTPATHWRTATTPTGPSTGNASAAVAAPSWLDIALPVISATPVTCPAPRRIRQPPTAAHGTVEMLMTAACTHDHAQNAWMSQLYALVMDGTWNYGTCAAWSRSSTRAPSPMPPSTWASPRRRCRGT